MDEGKGGRTPKTSIDRRVNLCAIDAKKTAKRKYENMKLSRWGGGQGARRAAIADLDDLFGNESHGRPPAAIFCRAFAYRYGCIFKGCHVKRQARPLNTFKFINGEGYTPVILYNTSYGVTRARTRTCSFLPKDYNTGR